MQTGFAVGDRGLGASGDTHPPWMLAHAVAGPYLVVGASAVGQFHLAHQLPRDDAFAIRAIGSWLAVGVADGVGSRPLSRYGASYVVEALTSLLLRPFSPPPQLASPDGERYANPRKPSLVPLPQLDDFGLGASVVRKRWPGIEALAAGLLGWKLGLAERRHAPPERDLLPGTFHQATSVGWSPAPPAAKESPSAPPASGAPDSGGPAPLAPAPPVGHDLWSIVGQAFEKTHLGLREHARSVGVELADLSCTALCLLLDLASGQAAVGQIGDGAMLGLTADEELVELIPVPETGDPQATHTLNRPTFMDHLTVKVLTPQRYAEDPIQTFFVMTDGLSGDLLYAPQTGALKTWAQDVDGNLRASSSAAHAASGLLNWLATYQAHGSWDDRTLVAVTLLDRNRGHRTPRAG
jgi:hypothetical protein